MTLDEVRKEIDEADQKILPLFLKRMELAKQVAAIKKEQGLPVLNEKREQEVLNGISSRAGQYGGEARILYSDLMAVSRSLQHRLLGSGTPLREAVKSASDIPPKAQTVACLGQKYSFSHEALMRLYPDAKPMFFSDFSSIFAAVKSGGADLGVLPVENSSAGSVGEVYNLILKYRFSIVRAYDLPIRYCLASRESDIQNIHIVYSHSQALRQCSDFLASSGLRTEPFSSTAEAAQEAEKDGVAAVCSLHAAKEHGLRILAQEIQNSNGNRTRFIVIGRSLFLPPDAGKISLCFSLEHRTGTLYAVLARFAAAGLNLTKIESSPIPGKNFEYDFFLDFAGNVHDPQTLDLLCELCEELPRFTFLGNYVEEE